jgi:hypothetical protein
MVVIFLSPYLLEIGTEVFMDKMTFTGFKCSTSLLPPTVSVVGTGDMSDR